SLTWFFAILIAASAQSGPVRYTVSLDKRPASHLLNISMDLNASGAQSIDVAMPAWAPGDYSIHNAWHNVQMYSAHTDAGANLDFEKIDKQTWRVYPKSGNHIVVSYRVFYPEYNDENCYIRGPQVFMYVVGNRPYPLQGPVSVKLEGLPAG